MVAAIRMTRDAAATTRLLDAYAGIGNAVSMRRRQTALEPMLSSVISNLGSSGWRILAVLPTESSRSVALIGRGSRPEVALKVAESQAAIAGLDREERNLALLRDDPRFAAWRSHAPRLMGHGSVDGRRYTVESAFDGPTLRGFLGLASAQAALSEAVRGVQAFHAATATVRTVDDLLLGAWVDEPICTLEETLKAAGRLCGRELPLGEAIRDTIRSRILGARLDVGFVHGDFFPDNVLMSPAHRFLGLVDWENAQVDYPVCLDRLTMLLSVRMQRRRRELGSIVLDILEERRLSGDERAWLNHGELFDEDLAEGLVLLAWLHLVSASAVKAPRSLSWPVWLTLNVDAVLTSVQKRSGKRVMPPKADRLLPAARTSLRLGLDRVIDEARFRLDVISGADYQPLPRAQATRLDQVKRDAGSWSRLEQIAKVVAEVGAATAVDIGANAGFFSIALAERGLNVAAVEADPRFGRIIAHRARHSGPAGTVALMELTIDARTVDLVPAADAVLFLSVWHHLVRRDGFEQAGAALRTLWARAGKVLFFDTGQTEMGSGFRLPDMTPSPREWIESYLGQQCEHGTIEWLGSHQAFGPHHEPATRELFVVRREFA
jgi:SAM-dependent methyltransferase